MEMSRDSLSSQLPGLVRLEVITKCWANIPIPVGRDAKVATQMAASLTFHEYVIVGAIVRAHQGPAGIICGS